MRLIIEQSDFRRLSPETQRELIETAIGASTYSSDSWV